jgi:DNA-binding MarR family transcriptional regulator
MESRPAPTEENSGSYAGRCAGTVLLLPKGSRRTVPVFVLAFVANTTKRSYIYSITYCCICNKNTCKEVAMMKDILREIGMIARALDSISNIEFKEYDLTKGQYLYLVRICENPGIIQEKLAEMIKVDRTTAARAIKKLEMNGFIEKKDDEHNKKIKKLFPTEKGKNVYPFIRGENDYSNTVALEGFSESEVETIQHLLQRVRKNIEKDWEYVKKGNKRIY